MNLVQIENSLPNGFHDASIEAIEIDYTLREALMRMQIFIGTPDAATEQEREAYKSAELYLSGVLYFAIGAPDPSYSYSEKEPLWIDAGDAKNGSGPVPPIPIDLLPDGAFTHWFYVNDWNSFIIVAATSADLRWK